MRHQRFFFALSSEQGASIAAAMDLGGDLILNRLISAFSLIRPRRDCLSDSRLRWDSSPSWNPILDPDETDTLLRRWLMMFVRAAWKSGKGLHSAMALNTALAVGFSIPAHAAESKPVSFEVETRQRYPHKEDLHRFQHLGSGIGWDFNPDSATTAELKQLGVTALRLINIGEDGRFAPSGEFLLMPSHRLDAGLDTAQALGAEPHIVFALGLPAEMSQKTENGMPAPSDWGKYESYCEALFRYVLVTRGFSHASFEVGNEPDIGGTPVQALSKPPFGSAALYQGYLELYRHTAEAAVRFEQREKGP